MNKTKVTQNMLLGGEESCVVDHMGLEFAGENDVSRLYRCLNAILRGLGFISMQEEAVYCVLMSKA